MVTYFDTSAPGAAGPLTASGLVYYFGAETAFWFTAISNLIQGQSTGPTVTFTIVSKRAGSQTINIDYGQPATAPVKLSGYAVYIAVPTGGNPVSVRCVLASNPVPIAGASQSVATSGGSNAPQTVVATGSLTGTAVSMTAAPPTNRKWFLYAVLASFKILTNSGGDLEMTACKLGIQTNQAGDLQYAAAGWEADISDVEMNEAGELMQCAFMPIGANYFPGGEDVIEDGAILAPVIPFMLALEPTQQLYLEWDFTNNSIVGTAQISALPLGIEEPL